MVSFFILQIAQSKWVNNHVISPLLVPLNNKVQLVSLAYVYKVQKNFYTSSSTKQQHSRPKLSSQPTNNWLFRKLKNAMDISCLHTL